jgi:hypothetical protein
MDPPEDRNLCESHCRYQKGHYHDQNRQKLFEVIGDLQGHGCVFYITTALQYVLTKDHTGLRYNTYE